MDILYSSSDSYAFLTGISILSLLEKNRECDAIHIYIMDNHISDINKNKLIEVVKEYRRDISFVPMPDMKELTGQEIDTRRWNISTFGRLYMASALPKTVHKVLNIDCDTIIVDTIEPLWNTDMTGKVFGGMLECINDRYRRNVGKNDGDYYLNGGIVFLNLDEVRVGNYERKFTDYITKYGSSLAYLDQDVLNGVVEQDIVDPIGGVTGGRFFKNNQNSEVFLLTNRTKQMVFWDANGLNPFYGKIMGREVDAKMNEWVKMMQGESMEDYAIRVNDETRIKQQQLFAQEVATALAGDRISMDNPFIDGYDASNNMLNIGFKGLPSIGLEVPSNEAGDFKDGKMKFSNAVYVLNDKDEFELAYVEVTNETTNKVYIYDNIGRTKLTALEADENFVPLEIMQQATREEAQLAEIKEQVIEEKKQDKLITDNTQINVKTEVIPGVDANGKKILNYKVGYQYEVINKEFSAKEDFPSGGYNIERSNAAMSLMKIIKNAFEGDFAKYLSEGKQVKVIITGSADAAPIRGRLAYDGRYGEFVDEPYYKDGNLDNITVTKAGGITQNEQLALMRAAGVKTYIEKNVTTLGNTKNEYEYHVEVAKERGGEFRKINVEFVIMDAFQQ